MRGRPPGMAVPKHWTWRRSCRATSLPEVVPQLTGATFATGRPCCARGGACRATTFPSSPSFAPGLCSRFLRRWLRLECFGRRRMRTPSWRARHLFTSVGPASTICTTRRPARTASCDLTSLPISLRSVCGARSSCFRTSCRLPRRWPTSTRTPCVMRSCRAGSKHGRRRVLVATSKAALAASTAPMNSVRPSTTTNESASMRRCSRPMGRKASRSGKPRS